MSKINDNTYIRKIEKEIKDGRFATKEELIHFLMINRTFVFNNSFFRQELEDSFIKLNDETLQEMEKYLLDFYDKSKNADLQSLSLGGVSSFEVDNKDYIKIQDEDGEILVLDDSLEKDNFVQQFQDRQNRLATTSKSAEHNKQEIIKDLSQDKINVNFSSSLDTSTRDLTLEERRQFAAVMNLSDAESMNFLVNPIQNLYINKDTGEVYFVRKNEYGDLEVRKANEVTSETAKKDVSVIDDKQEEIITQVEVPIELNFEQMGTSDLEYIYENKLDAMTEFQKQRLEEILVQRKDEQRSLENSKTAEKVFVKKLDNALHTPYNGFVSIVFLCSTVSFFGLIFLLFLFIKLNIY